MLKREAARALGRGSDPLPLEHDSTAIPTLGVGALFQKGPTNPDIAGKERLAA